MGIVQIVLVLALVGFLVYLIVTYIPMPDIFQKGIIGIVCFALIVFLLQVLGVNTGLPIMRVK
jgi:hypothetical protein